MSRKLLDLGTKSVKLGKATLPLGFDNCVRVTEVVAIWNPKTMPAKEARARAKAEGRLIDMTNGRPTRSFVITHSNHILLSAVHPETLRERIEKMVQNIHLGCRLTCEKVMREYERETENPNLLKGIVI